MRLTTILLLYGIMLCTAGRADALQVERVPVRMTVTEFFAKTPQLDAYQHDGLTLSQAVAQVKRQYKGKIVSAETRVSGNRETHIIKILTQDGKVKTIRVPGRRRN
jgi:uncharacterized membrane protein YkoI